MDDDFWFFPVARSGTAEPVVAVLSGRDGAREISVKLRRTGATTAKGYEKLLPAVVSERFVRFRHFMRVFALFDRVAAAVGGIHDLAGELVLHRLLAARLGVADEPA